MKFEKTAKRINEAMNEVSISAKELSDRSGVSQASISQYMNGSHAPSNISAAKMAPFLRVNEVWLTGLDVPKYETSARIAQYQDKLATLPRSKREKVFSYIDAMIDLENEKK